jgi:hypothetical protein
MQDGSSESNFLLMEQIQGEFISFKVIWCLEPGKWLYLEKQFVFKYNTRCKKIFITNHWNFQKRHRSPIAHDLKMLYLQKIISRKLKR